MGKNMGGHGFYGYTYNKEKGTYEIKPDEAIVIQLIGLLFYNGYSVDEVLNVINGVGVRQTVKTAGVTKEKITTEVRRVDKLWLKRKFGVYKRSDEDVFERYNGKNGFPRLLDDELYEIICDILAKDGRKEKKASHVAEPTIKFAQLPKEKRKETGYEKAVREGKIMKKKHIL